MTADELLFFSGHMSALPLYDGLRSALQAAIPDARIEVKKTQISFFRRHMFAAVSFTPVRRAKDRPKPFLTVTFGLHRQETDARIDAAIQTSPHHYTHHVTLGSVQQVDDQLLSWLKEAAQCAQA